MEGSSGQGKEQGLDHIQENADAMGYIFGV